MELGSWKAQVGQFNPSEEARLIPRLPEEMAIMPSNLKRKPLGLAPGPPRGSPPGGGGGKGGGGSPKPGDRPPWVPEVEGAIALMFNFFSFITLLRLQLRELSLSLSFVITNDRFRV